LLTASYKINDIVEIRVWKSTISAEKAVAVSRKATIAHGVI